MCGIFGGTSLDHKTLSKMNQVLAHRGPDASGTFCDEKISLGHRRLAVVDLSEGGVQPMGYSKERGACSQVYNSESFQDSPYILIFNGEIYNFQDIRENLKKEGWVFTTESDSEVILAAYDAWGEGCVNHFNGMWAFCIYDKKRQVLFASRDRLGVKPFYYTHTDSFTFSSELKGLIEAGIPKNIDVSAVELYFSLGFIPSPHTIFSGVHKLPAAHNLRLSLADNTCTTWRYWDIPLYNPEYDKKKLIEEGRALLEETTRMRLHADVPIGAFLSGGLDSSAVVGQMRKYTKDSNLHTFSVGFDGAYDETPYIQVAHNTYATQHHHIYFTRDDFDQHISEFVTMYDEPMADVSGFPMRLVSEQAKRNVTVVLSGDGGDEIFGGYAAHRTGYRFDIFCLLPRFIRRLLARLPIPHGMQRTPLGMIQMAASLSLKEPEAFLADLHFPDRFRSATSSAWLREQFSHALQYSGGKYAEALRIHDVRANTLPDTFLVKVDRAAMFYGLEVRSPFLDYRWFEFAQRIPSRWKAGLFQTKVLMRAIIHDLIPSEIINRKKQGFSPPIAEWICEPCYQPTLQKSLQTLSHVAPSVAQWYREEHNTLVTAGAANLIRLFIFQKWYEHWIESKT